MLISRRFAYLALAIVASLASRAEAGGKCRVKFYLWNADKDKEIGCLEDQLKDGVLCKPDYKVSIEARPTSACDEESALLELYSFPYNYGKEETITREENGKPYTIFGDEPGKDIAGRKLEPGHYSMVAHVYEKNELEGEWLGSGEVKFEVQDCEQDEDDDKEEDKKCGVDFILWNAEKDKEVDKLKKLLDSDNVLETPSYRVNIEARPTCNKEVESAKLELYGYPYNNGPEKEFKKTDNEVPYTIFRVDDGNVKGEYLVPGYWTIVAHFFEKNHLRGDWEFSDELKFEVQDHP